MAVEIPKPKHGFRREMSFLERLYFPAIFKGLRVTIKHFFGHRWTIEYPDVIPEAAPRFRGLHVLKRDEEGRERCTACLLCMYVCPANAIHIEPALATPEDQDQYAEEKYARVFDINMLRCIFCGQCEEACPCGSIYLTPDYETADNDIDHFIYGKDRLMEPEGTPLWFKE